jgi:hypothetical protein
VEIVHIRGLVPTGAFNPNGVILESVPGGGHGPIFVLEHRPDGVPPCREVKQFSVREKTAVQSGAGGLLYLCEEPIPIDSLNRFIPCNLI